MRIFRKFAATICLLCSMLLMMGAGMNADNADLFDEIEQRPLVLEYPEADVSIERYSTKKKKTVPIELQYPLRMASGAYFMALSDLQKIVGGDKVTYSEGNETLTIHQINRVTMALDTPAYIKQSGRAETSVYPTYADDVLYVPMRFILEEMGYTVNISDDQTSVVIAADRASRKVVPLRQIDVDAVEPYRDGTMATKILDLNGADLLAWGEKVPRNLATVYHIDAKGKIRYTRQLALEEPRGYDEGTKTAVAMDPYYVHLYGMPAGIVQTISKPYSMRNASDVRLDGQVLYFKTEDGIFSYDSEDKSLRKEIDHPVARYEVSNGRIVSLEEGVLSVKEGRSAWLLPERGDFSFIMDEQILVVDDADLGLCRVYDLESKKRVMTTFYDRDRPHSLRLVSGRYLTLGQGNEVQLIDILSNATDELDLINIEPTIHERRVEWLWNGNVLRGYVHSDGKKIAQNITVRHP